MAVRSGDSFRLPWRRFLPNAQGLVFVTSQLKPGVSNPRQGWYPDERCLTLGSVEASKVPSTDQALVAEACAGRAAGRSRGL